MIFQTVLSQLAPHDCLGCRAEGSLLCHECASDLVPIPERCYRCRGLNPAGRTCHSCRSSTEIYAVRAVTPYRNLAKGLIWQLKFSGAQAAAREMADLMALLLIGSEEIVIVPIPTATTRVRKRGYDQAVLLARAVARRSGHPYAPSLRRLGQHHQVGATRTQRITQLQEAYRCIRPELIEGKHVVLIDDVVTTGATLEAAARIMKAGGAARVSGLVFAQA